jgi:hypothetical protein
MRHIQSCSLAVLKTDDAFSEALSAFQVVGDRNFGDSEITEVTKLFDGP